MATTAIDGVVWLLSSPLLPVCASIIGRAVIAHCFGTHSTTQTTATGALLDFTTEQQAVLISTGAAGIGTVNELLLQSHTGVIRLFPQVPPGQPASFYRLGARGGFVVSASLEWIGAGNNVAVVTNVTIASLAGQTVALLSPWGVAHGVQVTTLSGAHVDAKQAGCSPSACTFTWPTKEGEGYTVVESS